MSYLPWLAVKAYVDAATGAGVPIATITVKITGTVPNADDAMNINTGTFGVAGAQTVLEAGGTLLLPTTASAFNDDARIKIYRNGVWQTKGAFGAADTLVYWVSTTTLAFSFKLKKNDIIYVQTPESF
jgi:hypothetical protein